MRWTRGTGATLLIGWAVLTVILSWMTFDTAIDKKTPIITWVFLAIVNVAALVAAVIVAEDIAVPGKRFRSLLRPRPIAAFYVATFSAYGVMANVISQIDPKGAVERYPGALGEQLDKQAVQLGMLVDGVRAGSKAPIRDEIEGKWGDSSCALVYEFSVKGDALLIRTVKTPSGFPEWHSEMTIGKGTAGHEMIAMAEYPNKGAQATFIYFTNQVSKKLTWVDGAKGPQEYRPC